MAMGLLCILPKATPQETEHLLFAPLLTASPRIQVLESPLPGPPQVPNVIESSRWGRNSQESSELPSGVSSCPSWSKLVSFTPVAGTEAAPSDGKGHSKQGSGEPGTQERIHGDWSVYRDPNVAPSCDSDQKHWYQPSGPFFPFLNHAPPHLSLTAAFLVSELLFLPSALLCDPLQMPSLGALVSPSATRLPTGVDLIM